MLVRRENFSAPGVACAFESCAKAAALSANSITIANLFINSSATGPIHNEWRAARLRLTTFSLLGSGLKSLPKVHRIQISRLPGTPCQPNRNKRLDCRQGYE